MTLLGVDDVTKRYGKLVAVSGVSFDIEQGELPALIGSNGAGTTALYNLLTGKVAATAGRINFKGEDVTEHSTYERTRLGLGLSFQITSIFPRLSVRRNLRAPTVARPDDRWNSAGHIDGQSVLNEETDHYLELLNLSELAATEAETSRTATRSASRSASRWRPTRTCCCETNPARGWHPSSSRTSTT